MGATLRLATFGAGTLGALAMMTAASAEPPQRRWDGLYVGVSAGGGSGDFDTRILMDLGIVPPGFQIPQDQSGLVVGGHAGFNLMNGPWLIGLESSLLWSGIHGKGARASDLDPDWLIHTSAKLDWIGSAAARLGFASGNTLIYGKGGIALTDFSMRGYSTFQGVYQGGTNLGDRRFGWTVGLGAEFALRGAWSARLDYDYYDVGKARVDADGTPISIDIRQHIGRVGLSYALGTGR
jgi:outer membrane immunogenic protein